MDHPFEQSPHILEKTPADNLFPKIMAGIKAERQRLRLRRRMIIFSFISLVAMVVIIPAWQSFQQQATQSGFNEYWHLFFVDFNLALSYWQEFSLSLLESLPALSLAALLGVVIIAFASLKRVVFYHRCMIKL